MYHYNNVKERAEKILNSLDFTDCEFSVGPEGVKFKAHRCFINVVCPDLLKKNTAEDNSENANGIINLDGIDPVGFKGLLSFIYTDFTEFGSIMEACSVYFTATKYQVLPLEESCKRFIKEKFTAVDVCSVHEFSLSNNLEHIETLCLDVIRKDPVAVFENNSFLCASVRTVETIVKLDDIGSVPEDKIFFYVKKWAKKQSETKNISMQDMVAQMGEILKSIRFLTMSVEGFKTHVQGSCLLSNSEKAAIALNICNFSFYPYPKKFSANRNPRRVTSTPPKSPISQPTFSFPQSSKIKPSSNAKPSDTGKFSEPFSSFQPNTSLSGFRFGSPGPGLFSTANTSNLFGAQAVPVPTQRTIPSSAVSLGSSFGLPGTKGTPTNGPDQPSAKTSDVTPAPTLVLRFGATATTESPVSTSNDGKPKENPELGAAKVPVSSELVLKSATSPPPSTTPENKSSSEDDEDDEE